jgi:hypothetical protein
MSKLVLPLAVALVASAAVAAPHSSHTAAPAAQLTPAASPTAPAAGPAQATGVKLSATLAGSPSSDPDAAGTFAARVNVGQQKFCYDFSITNFDTPITGAHIHKLADNAVVLPLPIAADGSPSVTNACADIPTKTLAQDLIQNPSAYYVNFHNAAHPDGAVRGTLEKGVAP